MDDLMLYGVVGWDISALDSVRAIKSSKGKAMSARINSPGGSVWEGLAIATAIREHGKIETHVDGLAASMGSVLFVSGSSRVMAQGSRLMIHNPSSMAGGESKDLRKEADVLDDIATDMAKLYAAASNGKLTEASARELMDAETWFSADEAVAVGLADRVEGTAVACRIPISMHYRNVPEDIKMEDPTNEPTEPKASLLDRMIAALKPGNDHNTELATVRAELTEASASLVEAVAKIAEAQAEMESVKAAHAEELARITTEHAAAIEAARVEGAQNYAAGIITGSAPEPLAHVEPDPSVPALERWNRMHEEGRHGEAFAFYEANKTEIDNARKGKG